MERKRLECLVCLDKCPQEDMAKKIAEGRMYVTKELIRLQKELEEYKRLEEQGLLLKLPCEVGSTVYVITTCKDFGKVLDGTLWGENGGFGTATGYYCPYELNDSCPHDDGFEECEGGCECFENTNAIFEDYVESIMIYADENVVFLGNCGSVGFFDFGKTVFLTKEEAEAKLKSLEEKELQNE